MRSDAEDMSTRVSAVYVGAVAGEISSPCTRQNRAAEENDSFFSVARAPVRGRTVTKPAFAVTRRGLPWCPASRISTSPVAKVRPEAATVWRFGHGDACVPGLLMLPPVALR